MATSATSMNNSSIDSIIKQAYGSFGRTPDPEGYNYWYNKVQSGELTADKLRGAIITDARNIVSKHLAAGESVDQIAKRYNATAEGIASLVSQATSTTPGQVTTTTATPGQATLTSEQARDLIERSMLTGVPTAEFNKYGGYDNVYKLAQQAGLKGSPRVGLINSLGDQAGNLTYSNNYSYKNHPVSITKEQFFGSAVPKEYIQYLPDNVDDYASLAALAIANDPNNRNKTFDEIDWSFLKPKKPVNTGGGDISPATYDASTRSVSNNETVQGQLQNILDPNNPLMRRARAFALAQLAGRGLLNSSLATTAGYTAMIDKALPIAQQDAQTYFTQGLKNQEYLNQAALVNTNWKNEFLKTAYVTQLDFWKQANLAGLQQGFDLEKLNLENKWRSDLLSLEYGFKQDLQNAQIDSELQGRYMATYKDLLNQLNAILVDPNTDDATKRAMVNNYIKSIEKMRNSLRAIGQNVPDFDFSDYYVG